MKKAAYRPFNCHLCGELSERKGATQRYCDPCGYKAKLAGNRRRNVKYEAARPPRIRNKPGDRARQKRWADENRDKRLASVRAYNERNREVVNAKSRLRNADPEVKLKRREIDRRYRSQPKQRVDQRMKAAIQLALKGRKNGWSWESLVGYTLDELVAHLEKQFQPGMSWENIGKWHIDHIVPKVLFVYEEAADPNFRACWALTNLRPLWSGDNLSKGARRILLI